MQKKHVMHSPSFAVLHVWVGSGFEQSLGDAGHASHDFATVFLRAEGADQMQGGLHCPHRGCVHLRRVTDQKRRGKFVP